MGSSLQRRPHPLLSSLYYPVLPPSFPVWLFLTDTSPKPHAFEFLAQALLLGNMVQVTCLKGRELPGIEPSALLVSVQHPMKRGLSLSLFNE